MSDIKILLVDDSRFILSVAGTFFDRSCFKLLKVQNSEEAFKLIRKESPNLVIMDLTMPVMGDNECWKFAKADPKLKSVPIVMICGEGDKQMMEKCREAGYDNILTKPLNRNRLIAEIIRHINCVERKYERILCDFEVVYNANGKDSWSMVYDISEGGMRIICEEPLPVNTVISLRFRLWAESDLIEVPGVVKSCLSTVCENEFGFTKGMGIQFTDPPKKEKNLLKNYRKKGDVDYNV